MELPFNLSIVFKGFSFEVTNRNAKDILKKNNFFKPLLKLQETALNYMSAFITKKTYSAVYPWLLIIKWLHVFVILILREKYYFLSVGQKILGLKIHRAFKMRLKQKYHQRKNAIILNKSLKGFNKSSTSLGVCS